jgi:cytoskeletal protein CcmA (bactofilin family)
VKKNTLHIERDAIISGDIVHSGLVRIAGVVFGQICADTIHLEITGEMHGNIITKDADIKGAAYSLINASGSLIVRQSARIKGMIEYHHLIIEPGANVNAKLTHRTAADTSLEISSKLATLYNLTKQLSS